MVAHSDLAFVIDARGHERAEMEDDPGSREPQSSSFSSLLLARISAVDCVSGQARTRAASPCAGETVAVVGQSRLAGVIGAALAPRVAEPPPSVPPAVARPWPRP